MIRRRFSLSLLSRVVACLALALVGQFRARAETAGHGERAKPPVAHSEPADAQASPAKEARASKASGTDQGKAAQSKPDGTGKAAPAKSSAEKHGPEETKGLLNLAGSLADRGDFEAAEIALRQVINSADPSSPDVRTGLLSLARMHRKKGELTKAAAIYERYLKDYPGDERTPDALLDLGRTLRDLGVHKMAIARFYSVINSTLKLPSEGFDRYQVLAKTAQFEIAETHFQAGDFVEAAKFYSRLRLLDLAPVDRARAHFKSGYALRLQGNLEGATSTLRAYISQYPDDENVPEARYLLAVTLRELKRPQDAFAATLELLRTEKSRVSTDPKRWAYWQRRTGNQLANDFFETGDTLNAHAIYSSLLELAAEPTWRLPITYQLALCYERLGLGERARAAYRSILEAGGSTPPPDLAELTKMAAWRIEHLEWREKTGHQITQFFESSTGKSSVLPAIPASTTASHP